MGQYDVAQICLNGHVINTYAKSEPDQNNRFCSTCGEKTITACQTCQHDIRGEYIIEDYLEYGVNSGYFERPSFCSNCGEPFPWTVTRIQSAQEYVRELDELSEDEKEILSKSLPELVKDSPKTIVAATRFKKIVSKLGAPATKVFKDILIDIVKEGVKKSIWG